MRLPKGTLKIIEQRTGIRRSHLCEYASTTRRPGRVRSLFLEKKTLIPASLWMFGSSDQIKMAIIERCK